MTALFSYAKNRRTAAILSAFAGFAIAAAIPVAATASPAVVQDSGTGDVCDICSLSFDPEDCDAAGRIPYDSVEQNPDGSSKYPEESAPQPVATPKPTPKPTATPKPSPSPVATSTPKPAPATTAAPKPAATQAPAAAPKADQPTSSSNNNATTTRTETPNTRGTDVSASRNNPVPDADPQSQVLSDEEVAAAEDLTTDEITEAAETEEVAQVIAAENAEDAGQDTQDQPEESGEVVAADAVSGGSTSGAGLALLGGLVAASGAGLGVHYLRKSRSADTN